ncbi:MAG TPA: ATP-binding cassette domain-containing protein [Actinomycetes bacterium]|nr:ATP-binding cassette domain-containing protein [Actinomycetes bacterium]
MADVLLDDVSRVFPDGSAAVSHLTLHVRQGELMAIVGPSGCGKSTVLRLIAGLDPLATGTISIGGRVVNRLPPGERNVAMVFEAAALYPHLTAAQNLRFALSLRKLPADEIQQRVDAETRVLRLGRFLDRKPRTLSAGQRQRVAVGRATVRVPSVFLLDEPLTHMDAGERTRLRTELAQLQHGLGVTAVYVTHDQSQAMAVGDRVAVMRAGRIEQVDEPRTLYRRPANAFVASFMGEPAMNLLDGYIEEEAGTTYVVVGGQRLRFPGTPSGLLRGRTGPVTVGLRPEHVTDAGSEPGLPVLFSTAARIERLGSQLLVSCPLATTAVTVPDTPGVEHEPTTQARLIARFPRGHPVRRGDRVELAVDVSELSLFDPATGQALWNPA